jgi:hypothetical protein
MPAVTGGTVPQKQLHALSLLGSAAWCNGFCISTLGEKKQVPAAGGAHVGNVNNSIWALFY